MKMHVLTLSWNGLDRLKKLILGLDANLNKLNIESQWYIRDNGSKDGTINKIENWIEDGFRIESYSISHNRDNFSKGVNYLFEKANPKDDDLILLLNNDIVFNDTTSLLNMINLMTPDVGVVGAKLLYPGTNKLQHAGVIFSERYGSMPYHYKHGELDVGEKNRYFQAVTGACCLIRASDFKDAGWMPEEMNWSFDDILLNLKIGQTKKIAYCSNVNISHEESFSLNKNPLNKLFLNKNVENFKKLSAGLFHLDHKFYLEDNSYNEIKAK